MYIPACSHGSSDEHWLSSQLIVHWYEGVVRGEGPGGALPMDQQGPLSAIHHVETQSRRNKGGKSVCSKSHGLSEPASRVLCEGSLG